MITKFFYYFYLNHSAFFFVNTIKYTLEMENLQN